MHIQQAKRIVVGGIQELLGTESKNYELVAFALFKDQPILGRISPTYPRTAVFTTPFRSFRDAPESGNFLERVAGLLNQNDYYLCHAKVGNDLWKLTMQGDLYRKKEGGRVEVTE